jgi:hypothetical protein
LRRLAATRRFAAARCNVTVCGGSLQRDEIGAAFHPLPQPGIMRSMGADALERFARSIETAVYRGEVASYRDALAAEESEAAGALGRATGIDDPALLARLAELGTRPETLAALTLIPLIEAAWADSVMDAKERDAVLASAATSGIHPDSASYRLLEIWTVERPAAELVTAWREFIGALVGSLTERECANLRRKVIGRAYAVANAAGGLLDATPNVSAEERAVLQSLDDAFDAPDLRGPRG